jgi:hypothetical protein
MRAPNPAALQDRLDFSYFEYPDINNFERTLTTLLDFVRGYQARSKTGFVLGAFVVYFVQRSGRNPQWPQLNYGGPAGALLFDAEHFACMTSGNSIASS